MHTNRVLPTPKDRTLELLNLWLSLPEGRRREQFADTARAAKIAGVARRTLQDWIEKGWVASSRIGKKHHVYLDSLKSFLATSVGL